MVVTFWRVLRDRPDDQLTFDFDGVA